MQRAKGWLAGWVSEGKRNLMQKNQEFMGDLAEGVGLEYPRFCLENLTSLTLYLRSYPRFLRVRCQRQPAGPFHDRPLSRSVRRPLKAGPPGNICGPAATKHCARVE
jgi:hypothetical protein